MQHFARICSVSLLCVICVNSVHSNVVSVECIGAHWCASGEAANFVRSN